MSQRKAALVGNLGLVLLWSVAAFAIAFPYHLTPSEDLRYLTQPYEWLHEPFFSFAIDACRLLMRELGWSLPNSYLVLSVFCLAGTGLCVGFWAWVWTEHLLTSFLATVLFLTNGWTLHYLFFGGYAPLATFYFSLSLSAFIQAIRCQKLVPMKFGDSTVSPSILWLGLAGIFAGGFFLSSPSAPIMLALFGGLVWWQFRSENKQASLFHLSVFFGSAFFMALPLLARVLPEWWIHLYTNYAGNNFGIVTREKGEHLYAPALNFFRVGFVYSPFVITAFVSCLAVLTWIFRKAPLKLFEKEGQLLFLVLAHALILDLVPFTKLARTHFVAWPICIASLSILGLRLFSVAQQRATRRVLSAATTLTILAILAHSGIFAREYFQLKQMPNDFLKTIAQGRPIYILESDPHRGPLETWLSLPLVSIQSVNDIPKEGPGALLLGPSGKDSGLSGLRASLTRDFFPLLPPGALPKDVSALGIPFHAYFKGLLMEEEVSQAYYFNGRSPSPYEDLKKLRLFTWG